MGVGAVPLLFLYYCALIWQLWIVQVEKNFLLPPTVGLAVPEWIVHCGSANWDSARPGEGFLSLSGRGEGKKADRRGDIRSIQRVPVVAPTLVVAFRAGLEKCRLMARMEINKPAGLRNQAS